MAEGRGHVPKGGFMQRWVWAALVAGWCCVSTGPSSAATPQQVDETVKKTVAWLYAQQKDGTWEAAPARDSDGKPWSVKGGQWGGQTGLVTYALLAAGESPQDERIIKSVEFLKKAELVGTYAL